MGVTIVTRAIPNIMSVMRAAVSAAACRLPVLTSMMPQLTSVVPPWLREEPEQGDEHDDAQRWREGPQCPLSA